MTPSFSNLNYTTKTFLRLMMFLGTDYEHTKAKYQILCGPNSNPTPLPNECLGVGYKGLVLSPKCLPKPKSSRFFIKSSLWVSVVLALGEGGSRYIVLQQWWLWWWLKASRSDLVVLGVHIPSKKYIFVQDFPCPGSAHLHQRSTQ